MASILFADALAFLVPKPEEIEALKSAASFFERRGHRAEVLDDPRRMKEQAAAECPDVLVTDLVPVHEWAEVLQELERSGRKARVVVLASITAEPGCVLPVSEQFPGCVAGYVIRPYTHGMTPKQQGSFRIYLPFQEQLILTVGHALVRMGLHLPQAGE